MTAKEYIKNKYTYGGANEHSEFNYSEVCNLMEEYGKQCYIQGSNDYHKVIIDSLPDSTEILSNQGYYPTIEEERAFHAGIEYVITKIKGE